MNEIILQSRETLSFLDVYTGRSERFSAETCPKEVLADTLLCDGAPYNLRAQQMPTVMNDAAAIYFSNYLSFPPFVSTEPVGLLISNKTLPLTLTSFTSKAKAVPLHAMKALRRREGIASIHSGPWH
jgi:hypothetical protein